MKLNSKVYNVRRYQEGGPMGPEDPGMQGGAPEEMPAGPEPGMAPDLGGAPEQQAGPSPEQIQQLAQEFINQFGPEAAQMLADALMSLLQGGAPGGMPAGPEAAATSQGGEPVFRRGGKLVYYVR